MKSIFIVLTLVLFSCGMSKNKENTVENNQTKGEIILSDDCVMINSSIDGKELKMYPVNLDKQYHQSGLVILFDYSPSKAPQPTNCSVDRVVTVQNVSIFKK